MTLMERSPPYLRILEPLTLYHIYSNIFTRYVIIVTSDLLNCTPIVFLFLF